MPSYHCYFLDDGDHISASENIEAEALGAAIEKALGCLTGVPQHRCVEIWQDEQPVCLASIPGWKLPQ